MNFASLFVPMKPVNWLRFQLRLIRAGVERGNPLFVGIGTTKVFLSALAVLALLPQKVEGNWSWRIWSFLVSPPNEIGDTLAGIAGALAFLWIIVTVMLQSKELAAQREELRLTRREFRRMAKAQEKQEALHREQYEVLALNSSMQEADNEFEELTQAVRQSLYSMDASWIFETPTGEHTFDVSEVRLVFKNDDGKSDAALFSDLSHRLWMLAFDLKQEDSKGILRNTPSILDYPSLILAPISRLNELEPDLSAAKKTKFSYLGLDRIKEALNELRDDKWWTQYES
ncbi:hypothetical protein [Sulfitobacter geojensis]|uniref:hypothetical protein n=1 Tax=Sulfitobacter geojensis TaxID=1342299 RepID=UPI0007D962AE|nr:hypothetical protein [Sulfitobacter geojensis]OAN97634.1 hypothetical protein A8B74_10310 [Sulfitobacter geojensis]